jgi:hypothetical protein
MMAQIDANEANIKLRLKWIMEGLSGVATNADARAIIRNYCEGARITGYDEENREQFTDVYPTVTLWRLRQIAEAKGVNILSLMQARWQTLGYSSIERAIMSTVVDSFQTGADGYWLYPAINISYLHQHKYDLQWEGDLPYYICQSQFSVDEASIRGYVVHSSSSYEEFVETSDLFKFDGSPTWDVMVKFRRSHLPLHTPTLLEAPVNYRPIGGCACGCHDWGGDGDGCNNSAEGVACSQDPDDGNCFGNCSACPLLDGTEPM